MILLAIETSGELGGAAVLVDDKLESEVEVSGPRRAGAELMPCIDKACVDAAINRDMIDVVAVNCGPGSYTGLRIGLATAATIGYAFDKPVVGVGCFEAMVLQYVSAPGFEVKAKHELWPVLDARRDEVMTARFEYADGRFTRASGDKLVSPAKLHEEAQRLAIVFGEASKYEFNQDHLFIDKREFVLKPGSVAMAAWRELADEDPATLPRIPVQPRYFRRVLAKTVAERAAE
jgi:tRNA threonylcarbamoyladenosine biosynthesis protein TsaB